MPLHRDCPMVEMPEGAWAQAITDALGFLNTGDGAPYVREGTRVYITAPGVTQRQVDAAVRALTPAAMEQSRAAWIASRPKSLAERVKALEDMLAAKGG